MPASSQTFQPGLQGQKALWGAGEGDAAWATSSILVLLGSEEQATKQESGREAAPGGPEAELDSREEAHTERAKCELHRRSAASRGPNLTGMSFLSLEVCKPKPNLHLPGMRCEESLPWVVLALNGMEILFIPGALITTDIMLACTKAPLQVPTQPQQFCRWVSLVPFSRCSEKVSGLSRFTQLDPYPAAPTPVLLPLRILPEVNLICGKQSSQQG